VRPRAGLCFRLAITRSFAILIDFFVSVIDGSSAPNQSLLHPQRLSANLSLSGLFLLLYHFQRASACHLHRTLYRNEPISLFHFHFLIVWGSSQSISSSSILLSLSSPQIHQQHNQNVFQGRYFDIPQVSFGGCYRTIPRFGGGFNAIAFGADDSIHQSSSIWKQHSFHQTVFLIS
jgi:hypothetical protein